MKRPTLTAEERLAKRVTQTQNVRRVKVRETVRVGSVVPMMRRVTKRAQRGILQHQCASNVPPMDASVARYVNVGIRGTLATLVCPDGTNKRMCATSAAPLGCQ